MPTVGMRRDGRHAGGIKQRYFLDEPGRRLILALYDGRTETIDDLARRLHVPRWKVKRWAILLGLVRPNPKAKPWTREEDEYLETNMCRMSLAAIGKHLGRTAVGVKVRAKRIGVNKSGEGYTMRRLCDCLGVDHHKVAKWIEAGWLRGHRRHTEREDNDMWLFTDNAIRHLIIKHPLEIDPRRADWLWLVDILVGLGELATPDTEKEVE